MKKKLFLRASSLLPLCILLGSTPVSGQPCKEIVGYYPGWQWYDRSQLVKPSTINYSKYTIINYAFFAPQADGTIAGTDSWADEQLLLGKNDWNNGGYLPNTSLIDIAHNNNVKVLISVGGWTLSNQFPQIAADPVKRAVFSGACRQLVQKYKLDGIDIDWEYPGYAPHNGTSADKQNFTLLMQQIKDSLAAYSTITGKAYLLTAALGASPANAANVEWNNIKNILDMINLMTYDFFGAWDAKANHNSPLYAPAQGDPNFNVQSAFNMLTQTYNVPASKINIGIAFYGRSQTGATGLHQPTSGSANTSLFSDDDGSPQYYNIMKHLGLFDEYWDNQAKVPYLLGKAGGNAAGTFVSYDNKVSVAEKGKFINASGARGAIVWELTGDITETSPGSGVIAGSPLADTLNAVLCGNATDVTSLSEENSLFASFYPNPSNGNLTVSFLSETDEPVMLEVYSSTGKLVKTERRDVQPGINQLHLTLPGQGLFLISLRDGKQIRSSKITVAE